jgi:hypothetical protein
MSHRQVMLASNATLKRDVDEVVRQQRVEGRGVMSGKSLNPSVLERDEVIRWRDGWPRSGATKQGDREQDRQIESHPPDYRRKRATRCKTL